MTLDTNDTFLVIARSLSVVAMLMVSACAGNERSHAGAACAAGNATEAAHGGEDEQKVMQLEQAWAEAQVKSDVAALDRIMADDYVGQGPVGAFTKAQYVAWAKSGEFKMASQTVGPLTVRVFGSIATARGTDDEVSSLGGTDTSGRYSWSDVWARRNGQWQIIASQATASPKR